jgi:hypothetical protein
MTKSVGGNGFREMDEERFRAAIHAKEQSQYKNAAEMRRRIYESDLRKRLQQIPINVKKYYDFEADMLQNVSQIIYKIRESEPTIRNYFMISYNKENKTEDDISDKVNNCVKFTNLLLDLIKLLTDPNKNCDILDVTFLMYQIYRNTEHNNNKIPVDVINATPLIIPTNENTAGIMHLVYAGDTNSSTPKLGEMSVSQFYQELESYLLHGKKFNTNATDSSSELIEGLILFFLGLVYTRAFIKGYSIAYEYNIDFYEKMMNQGGVRGNKSDSLFSIINSKNKTFRQRITQGINKFINPKQQELSPIHQLMNIIKESYASFALRILNLQNTFSHINRANVLNENFDIINFDKVFIRQKEPITRRRDYYIDRNYIEQAIDANPSSMDLSERIMPIMNLIEDPAKTIISMCVNPSSVVNPSENNNNSSNGGKSRRRRRLSKRTTVHGRKTISKRRSRK